MQLALPVFAYLSKFSVRASLFLFPLPFSYERKIIATAASLNKLIRVTRVMRNGR